MVKKIRFQENRKSRNRRTPPRGHWVLEPFDGALIAAAMAALLWLEWIGHAPPV